MADTLRVRVIWENDEASLRATMNRARQMFAQATGGGGGAGGSAGDDDDPRLIRTPVRSAISAADNKTADRARANGLVRPDLSPASTTPERPDSSEDPNEANPNNPRSGAGRRTAGRGGGLGGGVGYAARYVGIKTAFQFMSAIGEATQQQQALSDLNRRVGESISKFADFEKKILAVGVGFGVSRSQMIAMTDTYVSSVGRMGGNTQTAGAIRTGIESAKGMGVSPDLVVGFLANQGRQMQGANTDNRSLAATLALAVKSGMDGRETEVVQSIEQLTTLLGTRAPSVSNESVMGVSSLMGAMSSTGITGLQGQRGAQIAGKLDSFLQGGGSGAQQAMLWRFAAQEGESKGLDKLDIQYEMEKGIGSEVMLGAMKRMAGSNAGLSMKERRTIFAGQTGMSLQQSEEMIPVLEKMDPNKFKEFSDAMREFPKASPMVFKHMGGLAAGGDVKKGLSEFGAALNSNNDKAAFAKEASGVTNSADAMKLMAKYGSDPSKFTTPQDQTTESFAGAHRAMEDLATKVLPALAGASGMTAGLLGAASAVIGTLFTPAVLQAAGALGVLVGLARGAGLRMPGGPGLGGPGGPGGPGPGGRRTGGAPTTGGGGRMTGVLGRMAGGFAMGGPIGSLIGSGVSVAMEAAETAPWVTGLLEKAGLGDSLGLLGESIFSDNQGALHAKYGGKDAGQQGGPTGRFGPRVKAHKDGSGDGLTPAGLSVYGVPPGGRGQTHRGWRKGVFGNQVTSPFGDTEGRDRPHTGIDFAGNFGDAIYAPVGGTVENVWEDQWGGHQATIKDANGFEQQFAHMLSASKLAIGQKIKAGDLVGEVGSSGSSTGPHLHYETRDASGKFIDPESYLNGMPDSGSAGSRTVNHRLEVIVKQPDGSEQAATMDLTSPFRNILTSPNWGV